MRKLFIVLASSILGSVLLASCAHPSQPQPMPQHQKHYQSGHSTKLGRMGNS